MTLSQQAQLEAINNYLRREELLSQAIRQRNEAHEQLKRAIGWWDELEPVAVPVGDGDYWIVSWDPNPINRNEPQFIINLASNMQIHPEDPGTIIPA